MPSVKVKVFKAGSLTIEGGEPKTIYDMIKDVFENTDGYKTEEIKRGPKKKVFNAEEKAS